MTEEIKSQIGAEIEPEGPIAARYKRYIKNLHITRQYLEPSTEEERQMRAAAIGAGGRACKEVPKGVPNPDSNARYLSAGLRLTKLHRDAFHEWKRRSEITIFDEEYRRALADWDEWRIIMNICHERIINRACEQKAAGIDVDPYEVKRLLEET